MAESSEKDKITEVAKALYERFGRAPTTEEVYGFIMGSDEERTEIWNFGLPN